MFYLNSFIWGMKIYRTKLKMSSIPVGRVDTRNKGQKLPAFMACFPYFLSNEHPKEEIFEVDT